VDGLTGALTVLDSCTACGACLLTCPEHALVPTVPLQVRADRCTLCGECIEICPADALTFADRGAPAGIVRGRRHLRDRRGGDGR